MSNIQELNLKCLKEFLQPGKAKCTDLQNGGYWGQKYIFFIFFLEHASKTIFDEKYQI